MLGENQLTSKIFGDANKIIDSKNDFLFLNFEGTTGQKGMDDKTPKCISGELCFKFMVDPNNIIYFHRNNKTILNLANNHSMDYGLITQQKTYKILENHNLYPIGVEKCPYQTFTDSKIVFIGASPHKGTLSIFSKKLLSNVSFFKKQGYKVVVSLHMGKEGEHEYLVKDENEIFHGQNRGNIYRLSRLLIDNGADLIIGHGPHITRGFELYKDRLILYSLGNFLTYGNFLLKNKLAYSSLFKIIINDDGSFNQGNIYGFLQTKETYPALWRNGVALKENQKPIIEWFRFLNKQNNFNTLQIFDDGSFTKILRNN